MKLATRSFRELVVGALAVLLTTTTAPNAWAQYTPIYMDGFSVSANSSNLNAEAGAPRQTGSLLPISYLSNTADATNDYHHQVFNAGTTPGQPLLISSDLHPSLRTYADKNLSTVPTYPTMVSPNFNFKGNGSSGIIGKRITVDIDLGKVFTFFGPPPNNKFAQIEAGITIGADHTLVDHQDSRAYDIVRASDSPIDPGGIIPAWQPLSNFFGLRFIEEWTAAGANSFVQAYDGLDPVSYRIFHSGGTGILKVQLDADDLEDGNPWDGVGSTTISLSVNGELLNFGSQAEPIYSYTKLDGGFTDNFITMWGWANHYYLNQSDETNVLTTHTFDNLTVYAYAEPNVLPGDYNVNGFVDAADFTTWRDNLNASVALPGENPMATTPGIVDQVDYDFWKARFGAAGAGGGLGLSTPVPEPAVWILALGASCGAPVARRRG